MTRNMGTIDRVARAVLVAPGAAAAAVAIGAGSLGGIVLLVVAAVVLGTAATGSCPLYAVLGIDTRPRRAVSHA